MRRQRRASLANRPAAGHIGRAQTVAAAADLATEAIDAFTASTKERERALRSKWDRDGVDTEGLRNTLRSYRSLLNRLPAV